MKNNRTYGRCVTIFVLFTLLLAYAAPVDAAVSYSTFTRDSWGNLVWTQDAYYPYKAFGNELFMPDPTDPNKQISTSLSGPKDLQITDDGSIYVADSGNNRIVELRPDGSLKRMIEVPDSPLNNPEGVHVDGTGNLYIADTGNHRIVLLDRDGRFVREIKKPDSKFIPDTYKFDPIKLVVDKRGFLYIATLGGYQGLLMLDPDGQFQGFFGANLAQLSFADQLKRKFYSRDMMANEISKLPGSVTSIAIDHDGFIYTVTAGDIDNHQVKKLNFAGENLIETADEFAINPRGDSNLAFGEQRRRSAVDKPQLKDIAVDAQGNMTVIDSQTNVISQYDAFGNLLFFWSGFKNDGAYQIGMPTSPAAIAVSASDVLYIADDQESVIHMYKQTEFGALVKEANQLSLEGKYDESKPLWKQVLRFNANYPIAILGLAKAANQQGDYEEAAELFRRAGVQNGYSDSFWQIRLTWFQHNFAGLATTLLAVGFALLLLDKFTTVFSSRRNKTALSMDNERHSLFVQFKHVFYVLRHPYDGFTALRFEAKGSYISALLILTGVYASIVASRSLTSFTFDKNQVFSLDASGIFLQTFTIWSLWVVCHYLIGAIYRGEARFRDVFIGSAYCLTPLIIIGVPLSLMSNVMTGAEGSIYGFMKWFMQIWCLLLIFWKVQSLQNYSIGETITNVFMTVCTMVIISVLLFIVFGLSSDLLNFISSIYMEVKLR